MAALNPIREIYDESNRQNFDETLIEEELDMTTLISLQQLEDAHLFPRDPEHDRNLNYEDLMF